MNRIENKVLNEELFYDKLDNGLEVFFMPKKGFAKQYAVFSTNYGSNDLEFVPFGRGERIRVNEGIAHFLEHKMFEQEDGSNAFDKFAQLGVSANAYTNFDMTSYLFTSTENFYEALEHLIQYVQSPHFTDENVEKEKGIIAQEIKMYDDNPDWRVYFNTLKAMYINHPNRIDIAGTVESVYRITKEELYDCYNTFYSPQNMALFVVGDLEWDRVLETARSSQRSYGGEILGMELERFYPQEPEAVAQKSVQESLSVSMPMFNIGFKETSVGERGEALLRRELSTEILLDMLYKKGSSFHEELYLGGLINESFSCSYTLTPDHGYTMIGGESKDPQRVLEKVMEYAGRYREKGLELEYFERIKKKKIGNFLKYFDSLEFIANNFISYHFKGINLLEYLETLKGIEFDDVKKRLYEHIREDNCVLSVINPK